MDKIECNHNNLEKLNNGIYICNDCSLIRMIKFNNNEKYNNNNDTKLLVSKNNYYNIKNEINTFQLTKNAINFYNDYPIKSNNKELENIYEQNSLVYLKYRKKLIEHIFNLCREIKATYECYYLSILLLDILIHKLNYIITNYQLDLFSTICFIISKKFVEKDNMKLEKYSSYLTICHSPQKFINSKDLIKSEIQCLKILKYRMNIPTSYTIMQYMFICGIIFENEIDSNNYTNIYDECLNLLSFCINNNEIGFNFNPTLIAFSIIYIIRKKFKLKSEDTFKLFYIYDIKFSQIKECVKLISNSYFDKTCSKLINKINDKKFIKKSFSQNRISENKIVKKYYTPEKYININFDKNYFLMNIKFYKKEKNWTKEDKWFFRNYNRKRKMSKISVQNSFNSSNNFNNSINGNDFLDRNENIRRNI